jgi:hypothetical protein
MKVNIKCSSFRFIQLNFVTGQVMGVFYPSTQRHYRRLIYYLYIILLRFGRTTIIRQKIY